MFSFLIILVDLKYVFARDEEELNSLISIYKDQIKLIVNGNSLRIVQIKSKIEITDQNIPLIPLEDDEVKLLSHEEQLDLLDDINSLE